MLDDIERRAFLVEPARENAFPASTGLFDVELDECARQAVVFPRRAGVARAQPNHRVAEADRLSRLQRDVANDAVALVEQPEHRDALAHRGHPGHRSDRLGHVERNGIGAIDRLVGVTRELVAARGERHQRDQGEAARHDYSGVHA